MSLIQGPPGTGKTQTILNIIANAIIRGKTVAVVSNNNTATKNVQEKLNNYGFNFLSALLGNTDNLDLFFEVEQTVPNDIKEWALHKDTVNQYVNEIFECLKNINAFQSYKEKEIELKKIIDELTIEKSINDAEYLAKEKNISINFQKLHFTTQRLFVA